MHLVFRYTKALDELKAIRKAQSQEIKLDTQKLEFLKVDTDKAKKAMRDALERKHFNPLFL